jgi:hypothetical protein
VPKRISLLVLSVLALAVLAASASADPPLQSPTVCHNPHETHAAKITYTAARYTDCGTATQVARDYVGNDHCRSTLQYCSLNGWGCSQRTQHYHDGLPPDHQVTCQRIGGHQQSLFTWQRR